MIVIEIGKRAGWWTPWIAALVLAMGLAPASAAVHFGGSETSIEAVGVEEVNRKERASQSVNQETGAENAAEQGRGETDAEQSAAAQSSEAQPSADDKSGTEAADEGEDNAPVSAEDGDLRAALETEDAPGYRAGGHGDEYKAAVASERAAQATSADIAEAERLADEAGELSLEERTWVLDLSTGGRVEIELFDKLAPNHTKRIRELTRQGFYDGVIFHRVINGFMAQSGDPTGTGTGGSDLPDLEAEFSYFPHVRGAVSMARAAAENSANSQFFIVLLPSFSLDNKYSLFGRVRSGMEFVDNINQGEPPPEPSKIIQASLKSDNIPPPDFNSPPSRIDLGEEVTLDDLNSSTDTTEGGS